MDELRMALPATPLEMVEADVCAFGTLKNHEKTPEVCLLVCQRRVRNLQRVPLPVLSLEFIKTLLSKRVTAGAVLQYLPRAAFNADVVCHLINHYADKTKMCGTSLMLPRLVLAKWPADRLHEIIDRIDVNAALQLCVEAQRPDLKPRISANRIHDALQQRPVTTLRNLRTANMLTPDYVDVALRHRDHVKHNFVVALLGTTYNVHHLLADSLNPDEFVSYWQATGDQRPADMERFMELQPLPLLHVTPTFAAWENYKRAKFEERAIKRRRRRPAALSEH